MAHTFTPEETALGGRNGTLARHQKRLEAGARAATIAPLVDAIQQGSIGQAALEATLRMLARLDDAIPNIPVEDSLDADRLARALSEVFKVHRLATGQSTSNAAHATVSADDVASKLAELQARTSDAQSTVTADEVIVESD